MISNKKKLTISYIYILLSILVGVGISLLICLFTLSNYEKEYEGRVYKNVTVNNIDLGGKTKKEIESLFSKKNKEFKKPQISIIYDSENVATFSGKLLSIGYDEVGIADRAYLIGRSNHPPSKWYQLISTFLGLKKFDLTVHVTYVDEPLSEFIYSSQQKYDKPAKNALFKFENNKVVSFRQEEKGLKLDVQPFKDKMRKAILEIESQPENKTVEMTSTVIQPEVSLKEANDFGIEELVAEGKSDYSHSIPERVHNVLLAASKFDGILIPKGKTFSFNEIIGDISSSTGYKPAYIIKNGKTVLGDGGGVCQVSTTLFRAALQAGLPIEERNAHAYRVSYYENDSKPGFDATIFSPSVDLKFKNDTPASLLVQMIADEEQNLLTFRFYGKKDNRKIEISDATVYDIQPAPPPSYQDDFTLKKGVVKQVDYAAGGAKAKFDYRVTKDGAVSYEKTFLSVYRPWQAVFLVGQAD